MSEQKYRIPLEHCLELQSNQFSIRNLPPQQQFVMRSYITNKLYYDHPCRAVATFHALVKKSKDGLIVEYAINQYAVQKLILTRHVNNVGEAELIFKCECGKQVKSLFVPIFSDLKILKCKFCYKLRYLKELRKCYFETNRARHKDRATFFPFDKSGLNDVNSLANLRDSLVEMAPPEILSKEKKHPNLPIFSNYHLGFPSTQGSMMAMWIKDLALLEQAEDPLEIEELEQRVRDSREYFESFESM